jgi:hypothetical protein
LHVPCSRRGEWSRCYTRSPRHDQSFSVYLPPEPTRDYNGGLKSAHTEVGTMAKSTAKSRVKTKARSMSTSPAKPASRIKSGIKAGANAGIPTEAIGQHHRLTVLRTYKGEAMGMHAIGKLTHAGKTAHFDVSYVTKLGAKGASLAQAILQNCERDYTTLQQAFGGITPHRLPFVVQITADNSGASHSSCMGTDVSIGGKSGPSVDFIRSLLVAEADEVYMANFGHGWDCGASNGEGLSRVLANDIYKGVEPRNFVSSDVWLSLNPRPNFVDQTEPTDIDYNSIGCSVLFLNWLRFQLNHTWAEIIGAGSGTLAETYKNLTGKSTAWTDFQTIINAHFPVGRKYTLANDNPFPL